MSFQRLVGLTNACTHRFPLCCVGCARGFSLPVLVGSCLVRVFSRLSGCTPSDPSQFARHCRTHDHLQLLLSFFLSGFFNFHVLRLTKLTSIVELRPVNVLMPFLLLLRILRHVRPIPLTTDAGAWTLLEVVFKFPCRPRVSLWRICIQQRELGETSSCPGSSTSPSTFHKSLAFLQHI